MNENLVKILAPYMGAGISYSYEDQGKRFTSGSAIVSPETLLKIAKSSIVDLYLLLRDIRTLKQDDLKKIFELAIGMLDKGTTFETQKHEEGISLVNSVYWVEVNYKPFYVRCYNRKNTDEVEHIQNLTDIIDYLRMSGYDLNGLIEKGLAMEIQ